ncbi:MAG TPA: hypothetical protein VF883_14210 [Thermoanaerobaculia bacterium]
MRFAVLAIALALTASPLFAACIKGSSEPIGPPINSEQMLYNNYFDDTNCTAWSGTSYVTLVTSGTDKFYEIYGGYSGSLHQNVTDTLPYNGVEAKWEVEIVNRSAAGSERMQVELVDLGTGSVVEIFATQYASSVTNGTYHVSLPNTFHAGRTVRFRFRVIAGSTPGSSTFRIKRAIFWSI